MLRFFKWILLLALVLGTTLPCNAQRWKLRRYEVGLGLGTTQIFGDIGGTADEDNLYGLKDIRFDETRLAFAGDIRYKLSPFYSIKLNSILGFGHGDDADSRNDRGRAYKTTLFELSLQGEYYFISESKSYKSSAIYNRNGMINNYSTFAGYLFLGVGATYSKSKHTYPESYPFDSYITGGKFTPVVPLGIGLKYIISDKWLFNGELGYRWAAGDYLEGYSQIEASKHNDIYYFLLLKVNYRLETSRKGIPAFLDKRYRSARRSTKALF